MAERILIQFKAQGDAKLQSSMLKLAATQGLLEKNTREMRLAMTRLTQAFEKTERKSRLLNNSFATMRSKMLLFSFAMSLGGRQLLQFARNAASIEPMRIAFDNLQGSAGASTIAMQKLRKATNGTMSEMELLQQANNAMILGITTNADEMAKMFDMAQRLGEALGIDTRRSVESLITGIGRQSRLMLDNIGIIVDTTKAYEKFAQANQKTVPQLTDLEKKQAFFNATLEAAEKKLNRVGEETDTPIKAFNRLNATIENFTTKIGQDLLATLTPLINMVTLFAERLQNVDFSSLLRSLASLALAIKLAGRSGDAFIVTLKKMSAAQISAARVSRILTISVKRFARASLAFVAFEVLFQAVSKAIEFFGGKASKALNNTGESSEEAKEQVSEFQNVLKGFPNTLQGQTLALEFFETKLKDLSASIAKEVPKAAESLQKGFFNTDDSLSSMDKVFGQADKLSKLREEAEEALKNENAKLEESAEIKKIIVDIDKQIQQIEAQSAATKAMLIPNLDNEIELLKLKKQFSGTQLLLETELLKLDQKGIQFTEKELELLKDKLNEKFGLIQKEKDEEKEKQKIHKLLLQRQKEATDEFLRQKKLEEDAQKEADKIQQEIINNIQKEKEAKLDLAQSIIASNMTQEESLQNQRDIMMDFFLTADLSTEQMNLLGDAILVLEERIKKIPPELTEMEQLFVDVGQAFQNGFEQIINQQLDTGKSKFKDFADVVIKEIQRIMVKMAALKIVEFLFPKLPTFHKGGKVQGFNQGGIISMPSYHSGGNVDNVPIMAQEGEFVMRRSAVESIGAENLARMNNTGQTGSINITFSGNVMSQDFIESEAIPAIKKAVRRGADLGIS